MAKNFGSMTLDELRSELLVRREQREKLHAEQLEIKRLIDKKLVEESIRAKVANMTDAEKAALHQVIGVSAADSVGVGKNG